MNLGAIAGLTGLAKPSDSAGRVGREIAVMNDIENSVARDKQASMMMQEMEAQQYNDIAEKASTLLEPDRNKVKQKSLELQQNIRSKIEEYGSRKAFFENGGVGLLAKYKSELLTSAETLSYFDNKANLEKLMKIKESGKAHLISSVDLQSLNDYQAGVGNGKITYAGMKSEIDLPEQYFNYQEQIPAANILHYKDNYMGIYGNWLIENPKLSGLQGKELEEQLLEYTYRNHSGQGLNQTKYQNDLARKNLKEDEEKLQKAGTAKEVPISYVAGMNEVFNQMQESNPATVSALMAPENFITKSAATNKTLSGMLGHANEYTDTASNYTSSNMFDAVGKSISRAVGADNKYAVASAVTVPLMDKTGVIKALYPGSSETGGVNVGLNSSEFYSPNGEKLTASYVKDSLKEATNQNMTFQGLIYGYVDGNNKMVTQIRDSDGKSMSKKDAHGKLILSQEEKDHMAAYSGGLRNEMFAVLMNADGEKVYQIINANSLKGETDLSVAIGSSDNVANALKNRQETTAMKYAQEHTKSLNAKVLQSDVARASVPGGIFATPEFKVESKISKVADGSDRVKLHKAYYMALSAMTPREGGQTGMVSNDFMLQDKYYLKGNEHNFENRVNYAKELKDGLLNKNKISDVDYIKLFAKVTAAGSPEDEAENEVFAQTWTKIYELLNKK